LPPGYLSDDTKAVSVIKNFEELESMLFDMSYSDEPKQRMRTKKRIRKMIRKNKS